MNQSVHDSLRLFQETIQLLNKAIYKIKIASDILVLNGAKNDKSTKTQDTI